MQDEDLRFAGRRTGVILRDTQCCEYHGDLRNGVEVEADVEAREHAHD